MLSSIVAEACLRLRGGGVPDPVQQVLQGVGIRKSGGAFNPGFGRLKAKEYRCAKGSRCPALGLIATATASILDAKGQKVLAAWMKEETCNIK